MDEVALKDYVEYVAKLECAIYGEKKLMDAHLREMESKRPRLPVRREIPKPTEPIKAYVPDDNRVYLWVQVPACLIGMLAIFGLFVVPSLWNAIVSLICVIAFIGSTNEMIKEKKANKRMRELGDSVYANAMVEYDTKLKEYDRVMRKVEEGFQLEMNKYESRLEKFERDREVLLQKHIEAVTLLEGRLSLVYDENIVYPKYRNMIAMVTINEYIQSARCESLEGPYGAYNLFENELRQDAIISQLSDINLKLEKIRANQFALYHELKKSEVLLEKLVIGVADINNNTRLTAYFSEVAALAAMAPKYIRGYIY